MFSIDRRSQVLTALIDVARGDEAVTGAALIGSVARREADRWSDVDLALRLAPDVEMQEVVDRWSGLMQDHGPVADHLDIAAGDALYRVFLLSDSLQVDLSFWPAGSFGSTGDSFDVLFGEEDRSSAPDPVDAGNVTITMSTVDVKGRGRFAAALSRLEYGGRLISGWPLQAGNGWVVFAIAVTVFLAAGVPFWL